MLTNDSFNDEFISIYLKSNKINENLNTKINNINDIIDKFSKFYEKDDDDEYENLFNRINIYFTSIISEIKLSYYENTKDIIQREKYNSCRIKELESQLFLIDEKYKKEKEEMGFRIKELEKLLEKSKDLLSEREENLKLIMRKHDADIIQLITEGLLDKVELNQMQIIFKESFLDKRLIREIDCFKNNKRMPDQISLNNQKYENNFSIDQQSIFKGCNKSNLITIQSNKVLRGFNENDSQSCLHSEINKKNLIESKKSLDEIQRNIFSNIKSRNKLNNKTYEIKSLNDLENTPPIYETYQNPIGDMNINKASIEVNNLNNKLTPKTPNLNFNKNKTISSQTVQIDSTHNDKNSRSFNLKINSTANLVNNHELASKLEKINFNSNKNYLGSNVNKSYKNFKEINSALREKYDQIKDITEKNNNVDHLNDKTTNNKMDRYSTNYNNYKMIRPQKNFNFNYNKSYHNIKSELNKGNQNYKKSFDLDKQLKNLYVSQNQLIENNLNSKLFDDKMKNDKCCSSQFGKNLSNQSSYLAQKYMKDPDENVNYSSISKSPVLRNKEINDFNDNVNQSYNLNLLELNNKASKFSRNDKKNELSNLYLNTVNNPDNLGRMRVNNQHIQNKNNLTSYKSYNINDTNNLIVDTKNKQKNTNNKSLDSNLYKGIKQQSLTCANKGQKIIKYNLNNQSSEQMDKFLNFNQYNQMKKSLNVAAVLNNKSNSDLFNDLVVHSDSNKIINDCNNSKNPINENKKSHNVNKMSTLNLISNENCKSKKILININKKTANFKNNNFISQNKNTSINFLTETPSNKKVSKDSQFK